MRDASALWRRLELFRRDWSVAVIIALVAAALMQLPYALGYILARPGTEFTGLIINLEDASYLSAVSQGMDGTWQYHIQFTSESHEPAFLYGFYLALGHLARAFNLTNVAMWHLSRFAAAFLLCLVVYAFLSSYLPDSQRRWAAYLFAIFGAGFDWLAFPFDRVGPAGGVPVDFKMPEAHLFFSALTFPHFSFGIALVLISFMLTLRAWEYRQWLLAVCAGISNLALGIVYPFLIYLIVAVLGVYWLYLTWCARKILWQQALMLLASFAIPVPLFVYYGYVLMTNPVFRTWDAQAVTLSPNPLHYVLTYGAMLLLGAFIFGKSFGTSNDFAFLWIWLAAVAVLLYAPVNAQRRFVEGLQIPLSILATAGLYRTLLPRIERTRFFQELRSRPNYSVEGLRRAIVIICLLLTSMSSFIILFQLSAMTGLQQPDPLFRPIAELQAMDWLREHSTRSDTVLASYPTSSYIPARSGNTVFVGQRYETNYFEQKLAQSEMFFDSEIADQWRRDFLSLYQVTYLFWGPRERALGSYDPSRDEFLERVFQNGTVSIYHVGKGSN